MVIAFNLKTIFSLICERPAETKYIKVDLTVFLTLFVKYIHWRLHVERVFYPKKIFKVNHIMVSGPPYIQILFLIIIFIIISSINARVHHNHFAIFYTSFYLIYQGTLWISSDSELWFGKIVQMDENQQILL